MACYMAALRRLIALPKQTLLPTNNTEGPLKQYDPPGPTEIYKQALLLTQTQTGTAIQHTILDRKHLGH